MAGAENLPRSARSVRGVPLCNVYAANNDETHLLYVYENATFPARFALRNWRLVLKGVETPLAFVEELKRTDYYELN